MVKIPATMFLFAFLPPPSLHFHSQQALEPALWLQTAAEVAHAAPSAGASCDIPHFLQKKCRPSTPPLMLHASWSLSALTNNVPANHSLDLMPKRLCVLQMVSRACMKLCRASSRAQWLFATWWAIKGSAGTSCLFCHQKLSTLSPLKPAWSSAVKSES